MNDSRAKTPTLVERIRFEAAMASRPGQFEKLERLADEAAELVAELATERAIRMSTFRMWEQCAAKYADAAAERDALRAKVARVEADAFREAAEDVWEENGAGHVLALYVDEAGHPYALNGIQRWLRERADRLEAAALPEPQP